MAIAAVQNNLFPEGQSNNLQIILDRAKQATRAQNILFSNSAFRGINNVCASSYPSKAAPTELLDR